MKCIAGSIIILAGAVLFASGMVADGHPNSQTPTLIPFALGIATMFLGLVIFVAYRQDPH
jgi:hypothetical protein